MSGQSLADFNYQCDRFYNRIANEGADGPSLPEYPPEPEYDPGDCDECHQRPADAWDGGPKICAKCWGGRRGI